MSIVLEDLKQRDRRIARERFVRRLGKFSALMCLVFVGVAVATPVAFRRGFDAGVKDQAERAKPTCQAPAAHVTPLQVARDKYLKKCAENLRDSIPLK